MSVWNGGGLCGSWVWEGGGVLSLWGVAHGEVGLLNLSPPSVTLGFQCCSVGFFGCLVGRHTCLRCASSEGDAS